MSPLQAQSSARSLQAELEKLRVAENAAASGTEEAQHLKVIWLLPRLSTRHKKAFAQQDCGCDLWFLGMVGQGRWFPRKVQVCFGGRGSPASSLDCRGRLRQMASFYSRVGKT